MILRNGKRIDGCSDTVPIGSLNPFIGTTAPFGYLLCQGQKVSKTTYPELYAICGTTFGPETSTEFTLPDLRGMTIAGYKEGDPLFGTLGALMGNTATNYTPSGTNTGGAVQSHTLTKDEMPSHTHSVEGSTFTVANGRGSGQSGIPCGQAGWGNPAYGNAHWFTLNSTGSGQGHSHDFTQPTFTGIAEDISIIQPTAVLNWIVKAVMLMPNQSTVVNVESDSPTNVYSANFVNDLLDQMKREAFDFAHPVGSYYETSDSTWTPQSAGWYGTWVADNDGSALVSYKSSGAFNQTPGTIVGGETTSYTPEGTNSGGAVGDHTLTAAESGLPAHNHPFNQWWFNGSSASGTHYGVDWRSNTGIMYSNVPSSDASISNNTAKNASSGHNHPFTNPTFTGTEADVSTIQTSKVVYRWHRTA